MEIENNPRPKIVFVTVAFLGVLISGFSGWLLYKVEEKAIIHEFHNNVNEHAASFYREVTINIEALHSLAILFSGDTVPNLKRFSSEAKKILSRHKDIQALEWIPRVIHSERAAYESKQRQEFPEFEFTERKEQGHMVSAAERQEYFPVYYVEPLIGNEVAFGFDLASNPVRLEALEKSRDTATPQITARITLVQEYAKQKGFLAFLPIYEEHSSTEEKRPENLKGFVLGVFRIGDIFNSSALSEEPPCIEMTLVDETLLSSHNILHMHKTRAECTGIENITYRKELTEIWGRKWSLIATPTLSYIALRRSMTPLVVFIAGITITAFIAIYIHMISKHTAIILDMSRTDGLTRVSNRRHLDEFLDREWSRAIRNNSFISFILVDIDFFKLYNDKYGHLEGDECLKIVAQTFKRIMLRPADMVARYGGEEFAIVLPDTENAVSVANNCRKSIEELQIPHEFSKAREVVTISVGVCTLAPKKGVGPSELLDCADKALYKAKAGGRNRVERFVAHA